MIHQYEEHKNCQTNYCNVCEGGLAICKICHLIEGSLTTDCPGEDSWDKHEQVYKGEIDFVDRDWKNSVSIHSPARYR